MPTLYALLLVILLMTAVRVLAPPSPLEELRDDATRAAASRARVALVVVVIALVWLAARCREAEEAEVRDDLAHRIAQATDLPRTTSRSWFSDLARSSP